ncbi:MULTISPECIES: PD-(D/E)XK nuclease family protein [Aerococcus]|uniref:UvrD-like helicase C-terminal domain-containing protein n=3 Tax=Aerococcus TaxID=1375 RepID=A0A5N1GP43_9LACT|nr:MULTISPECIES: PD-(D/E)XK nuclease family protein [Aerococcus]KAA9301998.1 hypothetical protein F6I03_01965 [Aerococcus sanguinicola]MDK6679660.1 PD-(D/E)XK nuclease family protein [Aerococcus sp. UMB8608]MDK6686504.1 PD-(D/E)XK nuclease family protein [Aerococcus sp. UMB8623]MDK6940874.1 PD-(D/E)XK nuclease family protein [Aerococcus sp. UMB8487]OFT37250.1 hypothetical protein HMPREF3161_09390 [Aerococcus sp. HMSC06H08]
MTLQFLRMTDTYSDKSAVYADLVADLTEHPDRQVYYLVPDHMKFDMEVKVLEAIQGLRVKEGIEEDGASGMMRLQVLSFERLAWLLLKDDWPHDKTSLSSVGTMMLLRKVLHDVFDDLKLYRGEFNKIGFLGELAELFHELEMGNIDPDTLDEILSQEDSNSSKLKARQFDKLKELAMIYRRYEADQGRFTLASHAVYEALDAYVRTEDMSQVRVVIDGFYRFTARQLQVIEAFLLKVPKLEVFLTADRAYRKSGPAWDDLFTITGEAYHQVYALAKSHDIPVADDQLAGPNLAFAPAFADLDAYLRQRNRQTGLPAARSSTVWDDHLEIWKCESPYVESEQVANKIYQLVASGRYRYKDIQILTRDVDKYRYQILPYLEQNEIPYFIDNAESMQRHPLSRFLDSLYRIWRYNWRYQDVFNLLRSELLMPMNFLEEEDRQASQKAFRRVVDQTENVVLKNGYEGRRFWQADYEWSYLQLDDQGQKIARPADKRIEEEANRLKNFLFRSLDPLFKTWESSSSSQDVLTTFYRSLEDLGIPRQLLNWRDDLVDAGDLELARHHEQAWQAFIQILDEYVLLFGEEDFDSDLFFDLMQVAFREAKYSIVPPSLDSVSISGLDSQRSSAKAVTFVLGLTRQTLPRQYENHSLFSDEDRDLISQGLTELQSLAASTQQKTVNEAFIAYKTFLSAYDRLFLSYPYNELGEKASNISPFLDQVREACGLEEKIHTSQNLQLQAHEEVYLGNWRSQLHHLVTKLSLAKMRREGLPATYTPLYHQIQGLVQTHPEIKQVMAGLNYSNQVKNLPADLAQALYGQPLFTSVSQLELFNKDPFSYYLVYGLRLRERERMRLDAIQTGNYYHGLLQAFFDQVLRDQVALEDLNSEQIASLLEKLVKQALEDEANTIFTSNARFKWMNQSLNRTLYQVIQQIIRQQRVTKPRIQANELSFGLAGASPNDLPAYELILDGGQSVFLRGRIDRLDSWQYEGVDYLQVVDYKSSKQTYQFRHIYEGLSLQLFAYAQVALAADQGGTGSAIFGTFHQLVADQLRPIKKEADFQGTALETMPKDYQLAGYYLADPDLLQAIDPSTDEKESSLSYPYKWNKNFVLKKNTNGLDRQEWTWLLDFVDTKIKETAQAILTGEISLAPLRQDKELLYIPSLQYPLNAIACFDPIDGGNRYRDWRLRDNDRQSFFEQVQEALEEKGASDDERS